MLTIKDLCNKKSIEGDVGIEIEMEGNKPFPIGPDVWVYTTDNSLRGYSAEYVTKKPILIEEVDDKIKILKDVLEKYGNKINHSFRAGVHIHSNCLELTPKQIGTYAATYYCMETALTKFCGSRREGNFFCLRLKDAEFPLDILMQALLNPNDFYGYFTSDNLRYSALNLRSLTKHGSIEFRAMETTPDLEKISPWAHIIYNIKKYALSLEHREQIAYDISFYGPSNWIEKVIGHDNYQLIRYNGIEKDTMSDLRLVQELIYLKD
ncbi:amidoligase family protein [Candidatus Dojkabacteria bacterium]|uniref:Amidoligase family protein n=1 Tax=Candidatus Dojkabacteria bacterium TaxID=2099670 RepID=A0A955L1T7_9BACT|nr:amidoligase family protein [Candidatus Dojkabacteria bacterium]